MSENFRRQNYRPWDSIEKLSPELKTNSRQTQDKLKTNLRQNLRQIQDKNIFQRETQDKPKSQLKTKLKTNSRQTQDKMSKNVSFSSLTELRRRIVLFIYECCHLSLDKITPPISIEHLSKSCQTSVKTAPKTIQRLEKNGIIIRSEFKEGRGGWTRYSLPDFIYQEILHSEKLKTNSRQTQDKLESQLKTELKTTVPSSSSYNNLNTTTSGINDEWLNLDISPLLKYGFNETHKKQLATGKSAKLGFEAVQDSIFFYAHDLKFNDKLSEIKKTPIELFMGILRREGLPYPRPDNYKSLRELEIEKYAQQKQAELDRIREAKEKSEKLDFEIWLESLPDIEKQKLIDSFNLPKGLRNDASIRGNLLKYYKENFRK